MKDIKFIENIDIMLDEVDKPIDKAKFIISNVYYYMKAFYSDKYLSSLNNFEDYVSTFKNKFKKKVISNEFSFDLFNKYKENEDINNKEKITNEEAYYDLLYKQLINILIEIDCDEQKKDNKGIIYSFISLRNCFIFLEYLYLFICKNPDKINHYIIKIDISLLLDIPKKTSKRLINSDEFFYLNLIELKGIFEEIDYIPSYFISRFDNALYNKYYLFEYGLKNEKLTFLNNQLYNLIETLSKFINDNNAAILIDHIEKIYKNLLKDLNNKNVNYDELIQKYIFNAENYNKKKFKQILEEINEKNVIENCNYLHLIALNNYNEIKQKEESKEESKEEDKSEKNKKNESKIENKDENENQINSNENTILNEATNINIEITNDKSKNNEKEKIIKIEELRLEIKNIIEKDISELVSEEITNDGKDKETKFIEKYFTYNKVLNLEKDSYYDILFFLEIYKQFQGNHTKNIDDIFSEYKNNFISLVKHLNSIDYNSFYDLISDNNFQNEIIAILKSKPISDYLNWYRYYDKKIKKIKIKMNMNLPL